MRISSSSLFVNESNAFGGISFLFGDVSNRIEELRNFLHGIFLFTVETKDIGILFVDADIVDSIGAE